MERFFKPFIGHNYGRGINGKKVLVLGASFRCNYGPESDKESCPFFEDCTSTGEENRGSSAYDYRCPFPYWESLPLSESPTYSLLDGYRAFKNFASGLVRELGPGVFSIADVDDDTFRYWKVWSTVAFTNYIQNFVPAGSDTFGQTNGLSPRDFNSFNDTLKELNPDVVIIWGKILNSILISNYRHLPDDRRCELTKSGDNICRIKLPNIWNVEKEITFLNCCNPIGTYGHWSKNLDKFGKDLKQVLNIIG